MTAENKIIDLKLKETKKITGMFWHVHHDKLCEWCYDYQERADFIKNEKPKNEIEIRLNLFKKVKGKLPKEFIEACKKWVEAYKKWVEADKKRAEAYKKRDEADKKWIEAYKKWVEADKKRIEAYKKWVEACKKWVEADKKWIEACKKWVEADKKWIEACKCPEIEKLHKKECGCKYWDGKKLVFGK